MYAFNSVDPSRFPWCSGRTARECSAIVDPWSWWPSGSEPLQLSSVDDDLSRQFGGMPIEASVTQSAGVLVARMWAINVGRGLGLPGSFGGR